MSKVKEILNNPGNEIIIEVQNGLISQLDRELMFTKAQLESLARYALSLEQKINELESDK